MKTILIKKSTIVTHLPTKKRRQIIESLDSLIGNRKNEIEILNKNLIKPLEDALFALEEAKKGRLSVEACMYTNKCVTDFIKKFMTEKRKSVSMHRKS
jgi:hypothetical protein